MEPTFTGIQNLKIEKKEFSKYGYYLGYNNEIKQGLKNKTLIKISANLTDDEAGKDLSEFKNYLKRCNEFLQKGCVNKDKFENINLFISREEINDKHFNGPKTSSIIKLNDYDINPQTDPRLVMHTFLAKFTDKICKTLNVSENQKKYITKANKSIDEEARKCL